MIKIKHFRFFLMVILVLSLAINSLAQLNTYQSESYEWKKYTHDSLGYSIYFPEGMEKAAKKAYEETKIIYNFYSSYFFRGPKPPDRDSKMFEDFEEKLERARDWLEHYPSKKPKPDSSLVEWRPKELFVILYPNPQDFYSNQQVSASLIPPGVGGFTETLSGKHRVAMPYGGNEHQFVMVLAHELSHAWVNSYIKYWKDERMNRKFWLSNRKISLPPWFHEGFAEVMATAYLKHQYGRNNDYRRASTAEANADFVINDKLPSLEEGRFSDFRVYSLGFSFLNFVSEKVQKERFLTLLQLCAEVELKNFKEAWKKTFGRPLEIMEREWLSVLKRKFHKASLNSPAHILERKNLFPENKTISYVGDVYYDPSLGILAYYKRDEMWGVELKAVTVDSFKKIDFDFHQFQDGTWFMRPNNPPAIYSDSTSTMAAAVVTKEDRDHIFLFEINKEEKKARMKKEFRTSLVWIKDVSFINSKKLLFAGMSGNGDWQLYFYNIDTKRLKKLTDIKGNKSDPCYAEGHLIFINKRGDDWNVYVKDKITGEYYKLKLILGPADSKIFVDQIIFQGGWVVMKVLEPSGMSRIVFWKPPLSHAYAYKYGTAVDSASMRYPLVENIVGFHRPNDYFRRLSLVLADNEKPYFKKVNIDLSKLDKIKADLAKEKTERDSYIVSDTTEKREVEKTPKFFSIIRDPIFGRHILGDPLYGSLSLGLTNVTGEYGLTSDGGFSYNRYTGILFAVNLRWYNRSNRLKRISYIGAGRYLNYRFPAYANTGGDLEEGVTIDKKIHLGRVWNYPLNIHNTIWWGIGVGAIKRDGYFFDKEVINDYYGKFKIGFMSHSAFINYVISKRSGSFFRMEADTKLGQYGFLSGRTKIDYRHYLSFDNFPVYIANRVLGFKGFGQDPDWFFFSDLHRGKRGFLSYIIAESFGTEALIFQSEIRMPLLRMAAFKYKFWNDPTPLFLLSLDTYSFFYAGDVVFKGTEFRPYYRYGFGLLIRSGVLPLGLSWEWSANKDRSSLVPKLGIKVLF